MEPVNIAKVTHPLAADLEKYTKELAELQAKLDKIEQERQSLIRIGTRIEGVLAFINTKITQKSAEGLDD